MQLLINIDEEVYKRTLPYKDSPIVSNLANDNPELIHAVANGTPLPKGHGRLIDADKLKTHFVGTELGTDLEVYLEPTIVNAPTIIEAESAGKEKTCSNCKHRNEDNLYFCVTCNDIEEYDNWEKEE